MGRESVITQEAFETLLAWLDSDRERAGDKYEVIRAGLIKIFISKGFSDAEDLADETINRVIARLPDIRECYVGEPAHYFRGVARNIIHEAGRRREISTDAVQLTATETPETAPEVECLQKCLKLLPADQRRLVLEYYLDEKQAKIKRRKRLAESLGLTQLTLRVRAHRIRARLHQCVLKCLEPKR